MTGFLKWGFFIFLFLIVLGNSPAPGRRFQTQFRTMSYTKESSVENIGGSTWESGLNVKVKKKFGKDPTSDAAKEGSLGAEGSFARSLQDGKATD